MPAVSIIVPIYNVSDYLEDCLKSIVSQTLKDIEIICVNDGSTDSSPEIIERFARVDDRIKVINKTNAGYGAAMNDGLRVATGEYIGIVEPDDYIDEEMFETLYDAAVSSGEKYDFVRSGWREFSDDGKERIREPFSDVELGKPINLDDHYRLLVIHPSIWSSIYKKSFLEEFDLKFDEVPGAGWVDNPFFIKTMYYARTPVFIGGHFYNYRVANEASSSFLKDATLPFTRLLQMIEFLESKEDRPAFKKATYRRGIPYYRISMNAYPYPEQSEEILDLFKQFFSRVPEDMYEDVFLEDVEIRDFLHFTQGYEITPESADPKVSVIISCLNDSKYIDGCIDSLKSQTMKDFEVIFVDRGSTDYTRTKLYGGTLDDDRMKVIVERDISNAQANNLGLRQARANYVAFLDPSSVFETNFLEECHNKAKSTGSDVLVFATDLCIKKANRYLQDDDLDMRIYPDKSTFTFEDLISPTVFTDINRLTWNKFFNKDFLNANKIEFQDIDLYGNILFTFSAFIDATAITTCDTVLAHEHKGRGHRLRINDRDYWQSADVALTSLKDLLISCDLYERCEQAFKNYALHIIANTGEDLHASKCIGKFYNAIKDDWVKKYRLDSDINCFCNTEDREWLENTLSRSTEDILIDELQSEIEKRRRALRDRRTAREELKAVKAENRELKRKLASSKQSANKQKLSKKRRVARKLSRILHK